MPPRSFLGIRPYGTTINREYNNYRIATRVKATCAVVWFGTGLNMAKAQNAPLSILSGLMSCKYVKDTANYLQKMRELRPDYQEIVARAKRIHLATTKKV